MHLSGDTDISVELFGRCVHIVNRIAVLFIGEGIKLYLWFYSSNTIIYPWEN